MSGGVVALLAKAPVAGAVKTRFCPPCTPDQAAGFATAFLADNLAVLNRGTDLFETVLSSPDDEAALRPWFVGRVLRQRGDRFSDRIAGCLDDLFDEGHGWVMVVAADCPTIDWPYLEEAVRLLDETDVVFGPAHDGGCTLVGMRPRATQVFTDVVMSTDHVLDDMVAVARRSGLSTAVLPALFDLDTYDDLREAVASGELDHAAHSLAAFADIAVAT